MNRFEPIAIVGRGSVLPQAPTPAALFELVTQCRSAVTRVPAGRWGIDPDALLKSVEPGAQSPGSVTDCGGYVTDFDVTAAREHSRSALINVERLDESVTWLLHCAQAALGEAQLSQAPARSALIVGHLSYPSQAMTQFVEAFWLSRAKSEHHDSHTEIDARNRFSSGLPVHLVARAIGVDGDAFALDAACASALYALKLACDRLQDSTIDFALAGGLARADDLFLHLGFTALSALSPSGRSRPFHVAADGLLPAEGAALVALKRLKDAQAAGDRILGVIRGIGLSNDGRQNGFLAPSAQGQVAAMRAAYEQSGLEPEAIDYVECHATGTLRGDAIEIESLAAMYNGRKKPAIGSLKGNIGHAMTASGAASLIKMLGALEAKVLPPSLCDAPIPAAMQAGFDIPTLPSVWAARGPRRAAISNFGFGGNNAHLILEEWTGSAGFSSATTHQNARVAIVAIGVLAGKTRGYSSFVQRLFNARGPCDGRMERIDLQLQGLGFPPNDLRASLAQQTAILAAAEDAMAQAPSLPVDRTGVFIGMGCDTTVARHGLRFKLARLLGWEQRGPELSEWLEQNASSAPALTAAGVLGTLPNLPANRLHAARDFRGFGFTVSSEELSGLAALECARRALASGELDAALVGAADFSCEPAHEQAAKLLPADRQVAGDAAVVLVLMRAQDALAVGAQCLGYCNESNGEVPDVTLDPLAGQSEVTHRWGHAHAASGLLHVVAAIAQASARARIDEAGAWPDAKSNTSTSVRVESFTERSATLELTVPVGPIALPFAVPCLKTYAAPDRQSLIECIANGHGAEKGRVRLALLADDCATLDALEQSALDALRAGNTPQKSGQYFGEAEFEGEVGFTFTGAAAATLGAGRELMLAFPELGTGIAKRFAGAENLSRSLYGADVTSFTPMTQLMGSAFVCQAHAEFTRGLLAMQPVAAIGLSSGETQSLLAFGVWRDFDAMLVETERSGFYTNELVGDCRAARRHFGLGPEEALAWRCLRIAMPVAEVRAALAAEPRCYLCVIQGPEDCVIGGDSQACERVLDRLGRGRAMELGLDMVVHCAALEPFAEAWRRIHSRDTFPVPEVRFYTNAGNASYIPTREAAARALTQQALELVDFPRTIEQAYADGVRVFVEHGPRAILTGAVGRILEGRPHLAVALDRRSRSSLNGVADAVLSLWAAGVSLDIAPFTRRLAQLAPVPETKRESSSLTLSLPAHPPDIVFPVQKAAGLSEGKLSRVPVHSVAEPVAQRMQRPQELPDYDLAPLFEQRPRVTRAVTNGNGTGHAVSELFAQVARVHRDYVAQQNQLHLEFLKLRATQVHAKSATVGVSPSTGARVKPSNVRFIRDALTVHAAGRISEVFGPMFQPQDGYVRRVRMPEPPLLLADRVMLLEGEAGSMGQGRVVTETDVTADAWYLHQGRMSPGAVIEAGQADLFLISWLGADFTNRGERVYRLLGCELTFYGGLPKAGDTLRYDIRVESHAKTGDVRLFFFKYDCFAGDRLLLSVREGQAGFFSDAELASSGGVLWDADSDTPASDARVDPPPRVSEKRAFSRDEVAAFAAGDAWRCFGTGFERAAAHQRTPTIASGRLGLIDEVVAFDPGGGPWKRGYLRATADVPVDAWFYDGHFKNDPCMPGTLMADAATQALAFAMSALGFTIERDSYRFEPVPGEACKFVCRGQVIPDRAHRLTYEVFIESVVDGEQPKVYAALLCSCEGVKVFGCRRFGLQLVPDVPLTTRPELLAGLPAPRPLGPSGGVRGDEAALLACAWGRPSDAFGSLYWRFDGARRAPRLPGPPYHFVTRVVSVDAAPGEPSLGATVISQYDVPESAWYFDSYAANMPFSVLLEVLLQPCGWLASYLGFAARRTNDVLFRNLDGEAGRVTREVTPSTGRVTVTSRLERFAEAAGSTIVFFDVSCSDDAGPLFNLKTDFGFFEAPALKAQVGLPLTDAIRQHFEEPSPTPSIALDPCPPSLRRARLGDRLSLIDKITGYWPASGASKLARIRGRHRIDPSAWYFKAHFFQDPVQPGSLGLEALLQLARCLLVLERPAFAEATFDSIALDEPFAWRFRGQATPENREIITQVQALAWEEEPTVIKLTASASLWVDGLRVYEFTRFAVRATMR